MKGGGDRVREGGLNHELRVILLFLCTMLVLGGGLLAEFLCLLLRSSGLTRVPVPVPVARPAGGGRGVAHRHRLLPVFQTCTRAGPPLPLRSGQRPIAPLPLR